MLRKFFADFSYFFFFFSLKILYLCALKRRKYTYTMTCFRKLFVKLTTHVPAGHELFSGKYLGGHADYVYIPSNGKRIMDGEFKYEQKFGNGMYRKAEGTYDNNKKSGTWYFARKGSNMSMQMVVNFNQGKLDGELEYHCDEAAIGTVVRSSLRLNIVNGKIADNIHGSYGGTDYSGHKDKLESHMRTRFNYILSEDVDRLLKIMSHGSDVVSLEI